MLRSFQSFCVAVSLTIVVLGCTRTWDSGIDGSCLVQYHLGHKTSKKLEPERKGGVTIKLKDIHSDETLYECTTEYDSSFKIAAKPGKYRLVAEPPPSVRFPPNLTSSEIEKARRSMEKEFIIEIAPGKFTHLDFIIDGDWLVY